MFKDSYPCSPSGGTMVKVFLVFAIFTLVAVLCSSCNVTRKITTSSEYHQRGDTSVVIQVKTVETYDARKNVQ